MGEFFKDWRRKAGSVALLIACGLCAIMGSARLIPRRASLNMHMTCNGFEVAVQLERSAPQDSSQDWKSQFAGFEFGQVDWPDFNAVIGDKQSYFRIPMWSEILFTTLLSACLFLWKPKTKAEPDSVRP